MTRSSVASVLAAVGVLAIAVALSGCPSAENKPAKQQPAQWPVRQQAAPAAKPAAEPQPLTQETEETDEKPRDLGQPLVDDPGKLVRDRKSVV